jgi:hypothetical protein
MGKKVTKNENNPPQADRWTFSNSPLGFLFPCVTEMDLLPGRPDHRQCHNIPDRPGNEACNRPPHGQRQDGMRTGTPKRLPGRVGEKMPIDRITKDFRSHLVVEPIEKRRCDGIREPDPGSRRDLADPKEGGDRDGDGHLKTHGWGHGHEKSAGDTPGNLFRAAVKTNEAVIEISGKSLDPPGRGIFPFPFRVRYEGRPSRLVRR